jgi:hypothetical protein
MSFPVAEELSQTSLWTSQQLFLGETDLIDMYIEAIEKVRAHSGELRRYENRQRTVDAFAPLKS